MGIENGQSALFGLDAVLITHELDSRPCRPADLAAEVRALHDLARQLAERPQAMLKTLVSAALELCRAGSAGVSLLEGEGDEATFRWVALAGAYESYEGGTTPLRASPCGTTLERRSSQLFSLPARHYACFAGVAPPIVEGLVIPLVPADGVPLGTIWVLSHDEARRFDREDVRVMTALADFTAAALRLSAAAAENARLYRDALREIEQRRRAEERLRLLWESAAVLLSTDQPDAMLRGVFARIAAHLGLDAYFCFRPDEAGGCLRLESCLGIPEEAARSIARLAFGEAICGTVALRRRPVVAADIQHSDGPAAGTVKSFGIRSYVCHPMMADGQLLGTLSFASRSKDRFDAEELDFIQTLSRYVAAAYERVRLIRQLQEADRRKDEFLATLAHELRNPLSPIRTAVEILKAKGSPDPEPAWAKGVIERQVGQMGRLLEDLLVVGRITRDKLRLRREHVPLATVIEHAIETGRPVIDAAGHELSVSLPRDPVYLDADPVRLAQVFANLLTNSAKYMDRGGRIRLAAERLGDEAVVSVRDTGIGIAPEMLPRLFEMFSQAAPASERSQGGLGIGLSLVKCLVEMHGGTVEARSGGPGRGSEFTVRLPVASVLPAQERQPADVEKPCLSGHRIVVADDNRDAADSLAMMLRILGNDVRTVYDGQQAVAETELFRPDVALLDIGMPKLDGYEAARRIRGRSSGWGMMLVALTGWGQEEDKRRAAEAGFDAHLVKPVDPAALERLLAGLPSMIG